MARPPLYKNDPLFGPVCVCGGPKAKQAKTCQPCHNVVRGYGRSTHVRALLAQTGRLEVPQVEGELARLVEEQRRDDTYRTGARFLVYLDAPLGDDLTMYDLVAA